MNKLKTTNDLSIIIVNYNSFHLLKACLDSIQKFLFKLNYEIIIVDNNSSENGLNELINGYDNIILINNKENKGFAKANNQGVELSQSDNILLLNNDTVLFDDSILTIFEYVQKCESHIICSASLLNEDLTYQPSTYKFPSLWRLISSNFFLEALMPQIQLFNKYYLNIEQKDSPQLVDSIIGAFMLMRKSLFKKLGGFDEEFFFYHEDTDLCKRLKKMGGKVLFFPCSKIIHIGGASTNQLRWFQIKNKVIARLKYFNKHHTLSYFILTYLLELTGNFLRFCIHGLIGVITLNKEKFQISSCYLKTLFLTNKSV